MKTFNAILFVTMVFMVIGCNKSEEDSIENKPIYPVEIVMTDFSLPEGCQWQIASMQADSIYLIQSIGELASFISYSINNVSIDFEKYSLLSVRGCATNGVYDITKKMQQISDNKYVLEVNLTLDETTVAQNWLILMQVPKITENKTVNFNKNQQFVESTAIEFIVIGQGELFDPNALSKQDLVITNNSEWLNLIAIMDALNNTSSEFTEINIDFSQFTVIAVIEELKNYGPWSIDVTNITEYPDKIIVTMKNITKGGPYSYLNQAFAIIKIPKINKKVIFNHI